MKKKRLLIITPGYLPLLGGMEEQCYLLAQEALRRGVSVDIVTERTTVELSGCERMDGVSVFRLAGPRSNRFFYAWYAIKLAHFLVRNQWQYDFAIIRTFTFPALIVGLLKRLRVVKLPTIVTADTGGEGDELRAVCSSRIRGLMRWALEGHNFYNALCASNAEHMKALHLNLLKITRIYNGFDISPYVRAQFPKKIRTFLFLGQLRKEKGLGELIEAFSQMILQGLPVRLRLAGDGPFMKQMLFRVDQLGIRDSVDVLGRIQREERDTFLESGDCLILPSYSEGFPLVIGEAVIKKRAVIATDVADLKSVYGANIISFCKMRDSSDLARVMAEMVKATPKFNTVDYESVVRRLAIDSVFDAFSAQFLINQFDGGVR
jgi:glycosyltransferase involved in cell wall biosynthesis